MNGSLRMKIAVLAAMQDHRLCCDLSETDLVHGWLGDLCRWTGRPDPRNVLNSWNAWSLRVCDVVPMLAQEDLE